MNSKIFCLLAAAFVVEAKNTLTPLKIDNHPCNAQFLKKSTRYICDNEGNIECLPGWKKADHEDPLHPCTEPICESCVNGKCKAPGICACEIGWDGPDCKTCVPLPGCHHGSCKDKALSCVCDNGYEGGLCDKPICYVGKENACIHGTCVEPDVCSCHIGWDGEDCSTCVKLPGCKHGSCTNKGGESVGNACFCEDGWEGHLCDVPKCEPACVHGVCKDWKDGGPICVCKQGWFGKTCSDCVRYYACTSGTCEVPGECNCAQGVTDPFCGIHELIPGFNLVDDEDEE